MTNLKRKFLANLVSDLGKLLIGTGAVIQVFSQLPNWPKVLVALMISAALFVFAFFIHPDKED